MIDSAIKAITEAAEEFQGLHISVLDIPIGVATRHDNPGSLPIMRLTLPEALRIGFRAAMGKADWLWDEEMEMHIPCCSKRWLDSHLKRTVPCRNGPLTTPEQIASGNCGEHE